MLLALVYRSGNWGTQLISDFTKITELGQLNPGSQALVANGLTTTPGYPVLNPAHASCPPYALTPRRSQTLLFHRLQFCCCFLAAPRVGGERQRATFHGRPILCQPLQKREMLSSILRSQHYYCNFRFLDEKQVLRLSVNTLHKASERQCWHQDLNLSVLGLCSGHYRRHLPPQSQIHPLTGGHI